MDIPKNDLTVKAGKFPKLNRKWVWLFAPLTILVWMFALYIIKGIYPFGTASIVKYDLYFGGVPASYYTWDVWHSGDLFYDFTTACGFGRSSLLTLFYPQNLFFLLFPRNMIYNAFSILLIIKFTLIGFTSSYAFSKIFKDLSAPWILCTSLLYTFSGYNLQYYTNIDWLDTVALFPLLILFTLNVFKGKSKIPYFLVLTYTIMFNTYMAWFVVLSLVIFGGLYIFTVIEKAERKTSVYHLGMGTAAALLASCYSIYSYFGGVSSGSRFNTGSYVMDTRSGTNENINPFAELLNVENSVDIVAVLMFMGAAMAIAFLILLWFRFKKHKESRKYTVFFTGCVLMFVLEIVLKATMLLWHGGSYQYFPFRNGYIISFLCCLIIGYYISKFDSLDGIKFTTRPIMNLIPFLPLFFLGIGVISYADVFYFTLNEYDVLSSFIKFQTGLFKYPYTVFAIIITVTYLALRAISFKKLRNTLCILLCAVFLFLNSNTLLFSEPSNNSDGTALESTFADCYSISEFTQNNDEFERVINPNIELFMNYPYVVGTSAISNWTHSLSQEQLDCLKNFGYTSTFTLVVDAGGTQFSNALLRITDAVSKTELNDSCYTLQRTNKRGFSHYTCNYTLPLGITATAAIKDIKFEDYQNTFEYQEAIYESITGDSGLFTPIDSDSFSETYHKEEFVQLGSDDDNSGTMKKENKKVCTVSGKLRTEGKKILYLSLDTSNGCSLKQIKINNQTKEIPAFGTGETTNTVFPASFNSNVLELGTFQNETVNCRFRYNDYAGSTKNLILYTMDLEKLEKFCDSYTENAYTVKDDTVTLTCNAENDGQIVFIPLSFDNKWNCTVNGTAVTPVCILGDFMGIEVTKGTNEIKLSFDRTPSIAVLVSVFVGLLFGLFFLFVEKKIGKKLPKPIYTLLFILFALLFLGAVTVLYLVPGGYSLVKLTGIIP